jgi:hypothetical protein
MTTFARIFLFLPSSLKITEMQNTVNLLVTSANFRRFGGLRQL